MLSKDVGPIMNGEVSCVEVGLAGRARLNLMAGCVVRVLRLVRRWLICLFVCALMQYNNQQGDGLEEIRRRMAHKEEIFRQQRVSQPRLCSAYMIGGSRQTLQSESRAAA